MKVVVFRELSEVDREALRPHRGFSCRAFKVVRLSAQIPVGSFDYILVSSANALRFVGRYPRGATWVAIGKATADSLRGRFKNLRVLRSSNSEGVLQFFSRAQRGSIFFPRSKIADRALPRGLRKLGYKVTVRHTYDTKIVPIRSKVLRLLKHEKMGAFFFTSPSSFEALRKSFSAQELRQLNVTWVVIGPTTARALSKFGLSLLVAKQPSLKAMAQCLTKKFSL